MILHLWDEGVRDCKELHARTNIPPATIYRNIKRFKEKGTIKRVEGSGRPRKITINASQAIGQFIRQDSSIPGSWMVEILQNHMPEVRSCLGKEIGAFNKITIPSILAVLLRRFFPEKMD